MLLHNQKEPAEMQVLFRFSEAMLLFSERVKSACCLQGAFTKIFKGEASSASKSL